MRKARRIRWVRIALALEAAAACGAGLPGLMGSARHSAEDGPKVRSVVVGQGETLWDLARRCGPRQDDPRAVVCAIKRMNGLTDGRVVAGMALRVPEMETARMAAKPSGPSVVRFVSTQ